MKDDIPEDMRPIYAPYAMWYVGEAEGGPRDGTTMSHNSLTKFVERKVERKTPDPNLLNTARMSVQEKRQLDQAEKDALKESMWAKQNPHRYDFDARRKVWVYVEYPTTPLNF